MGKNDPHDGESDMSPLESVVHSCLRNKSYIGTGLIVRMVRQSCGLGCDEYDVVKALESLDAKDRADVRILARRWRGNGKVKRGAAKDSYTPESLAKLKQWELSSLYHSGKADDRTMDRIRYILAYMGWNIGENGD